MCCHKLSCLIMMSLKWPSDTTAAQIGHCTNNGFRSKSTDPYTFLTVHVSLEASQSFVQHDKTCNTRSFKKLSYSSHMTKTRTEIQTCRGARLTRETKILHQGGLKFTREFLKDHQVPGRSKFHQGGQNNSPGRVPPGLWQRGVWWKALYLCGQNSLQMQENKNVYQSWSSLGSLVVGMN